MERGYLDDQRVRLRPLLSLVAFAVISVSCFTALNEQSGQLGNNVGNCDVCHRANGGTPVGGGSGSGTTSSSSSGTTSSSSNSSGTTSSSSGSGSGTTSSSSSGSSSSGVASSSLAGSSSSGSSGTLVCGPNTYLAVTTVNSFGAGGGGAPIAGATVTEIGRDGIQVPGVGTSALSDTNGNIQLCVPLGLPVTFEIVAASYPTTYFEELDVTSDAGPLTLLSRGLELISSAELKAFSAFLNASGGVDPNKALVAAAVLSVSQQAPCIPESGWILGLDFLDGGTLPDGGPLPFQISYLGASDLPSPTAVITSSNGYGLIYNVDPGITDVAQLVANNVSGGMPCPSMNGEEMVTGRVTLGAGSVTFAPYFVP